MKFDSVSKLRDVPKYLSNIDEKVLIIYSPTAVKENKIPINKENFILFSTKEITKNVDEIEKVINSNICFEQIISIGGGTAIDIGKYISYITSKKIICIPTMLSTNSYATDKVALIVNGKKRTLEAKLPDLILIDENIMKKAYEFNLYGLADVLSIYTALKDWDIAVKENSEKKDEMYNIAKKLLNKTVNYILNTSYDNIIDNPEKLFYLIGESGHITNKYGSGKPESGSEHIFAKELESIIDIPHGISVANGIIIMSISQDNFSSDIYNCLKKLKLFEKSSKLEVEIKLIKKAFYQMLPRNDRYTIVNSLVSDINKKRIVLEKFKKVIRSKENVNNK